MADQKGSFVDVNIIIFVCRKCHKYFRVRWEQEKHLKTCPQASFETIRTTARIRDESDVTNETVPVQTCNNVR